MSTSKGIITPVLKFWGFSEHPFDDYILKGEKLSLFVNREDEVYSFHNALTNRLIGVYGSQGIGKSTFLRRAKEELENSGMPVIYIQMTGTTEQALYREILSGILKTILLGKISLDKSLKLNAKLELERLEKSIRFARESSFGAKMIATGTLKEIKQSDIQQHTEETSCRKIHEIIKHKQNQFIVIVDDLERVKLYSESDEQYSRFISCFSRTIDESFSDKGVCFALSLDEGFVSKIAKNLPDDEGSISFSFGDLIRIPAFKPSHVLELIRVRLKEASWKRKLSEFITEEAFWCLYVATSGHPRRLLAVLRAAMEIVAKNGKTHLLDKETIIEAINKKNEKLDEKDILIISYLQKNGAGSASDDAMQKEVGLSRSVLNDRLKLLKDRIHLESSKISSGKAYKEAYSIAPISM